MASTAASATSKIKRRPASKRGRKTFNECDHYGQRSSLRRAIRESLRDAAASIPAVVAAGASSAPALDVAASPSLIMGSLSLPLRSQHRHLASDAPIVSPSPSPPSSSGSSREQLSLVSASLLGPAPLQTPLTSFSPTLFSSTLGSSLSSSTSSSPSGLAQSPSSSLSPSSSVTSESLSPSAPRSSVRRKRRGNATPADVAKGLLQGFSPTSSPHSRGRRGGWHGIKEIVGEGRERGSLVYLVEWEGSDPNTGVMWPCSWVSHFEPNEPNREMENHAQGSKSAAIYSSLNYLLI
ncbi:hypothetical protein MGN70_010929 [Eutypa lata]|nr:hypothetical protein MGN70_010929 [Eutypa lata]